MLWPGRFPAQAKASLRQCLHDLVKLLEPHGGSILLTTRTALSLDRSKAVTDLAELEDALAAGELTVAETLAKSAGGRPLLGDLIDEGANLAWLSHARADAQARLSRAVFQAVDHAAPDGAGMVDALLRTAERWDATSGAGTGSGEPTDGAMRDPAVAKSYAVAVLPFEHDGVESLANDIARELTERLSRTPHLYVAAFEPAPREPEDWSTVSDAARRRAVRYLVRGAMVGVQKARTLRLSLVNGETRQHLWSKRISLPDVDPLTDFGFVSDLAMSLLCEIQVAEGTALGRTDVEAAKDFEVVLKTEMLRRTYSRERAREIVTHLSDVVARDPDSPTGHAYLATQLAQNVVSQFYIDRYADERDARTHAGTALSLAPLAPEVLVANGIVHAMLGDCPAAVRFLERARKINADDPHTLAMLGWQSCWLHGDPGPIEMIRQAEECAPHHPRMANWAHYRAVSLIRVGRLEEALDAHQECYDRNPNYHNPMIFGASLLAHLGRDEDARTVLAGALKLAPYYDVGSFLRRPADFPYGWNDKFSAEDARTAVRRVWSTLDRTPPSH